MSTEVVTDILHAVSQALQVPVIIILLILIAVSIVSLGSAIVEAVVDHRKLRKIMPAVLEKMEDKTPDELYQIIKESDLLKHHKADMLKILDDRTLTEETLYTMAQGFLNKEDTGYKRIVERTDIVSKLAPMLGLMGTLIPLGPGIVALGSGDTTTLSTSLLVAFDTTVAGLVSAAICSSVSIVRKRWYRSYMGLLETLMESILESIREDKNCKAVSCEAQ